MLDVEIPTDQFTDDQLEMVETAAEVLYGLIHARYILTTRGMQRMREKYNSVDFGRCPRVHCQVRACVGLCACVVFLPVSVCTNFKFQLLTYFPACLSLFRPPGSTNAPHWPERSTP